MTLAQFLNYVRFRLEAEITRVCPVDTGNLRLHIKVKLTPEGLIIEMPEYGLYVEYGTPKMIAAHGEHDPDNPVTSWKALKDRGGSGQTMPFIRNTLYHKLPQILKEGSDKYLAGSDVELSFS